jgi:pyruvate,water dikinase
VLAVSGSRDTVAAVRAVHESATNAGALSYRANRGLDADGRMAVVVQRLVDADTAGVLFTRNPVTGAEERVIEASWGLGEAVVAGIVTPDHYRVSRGGSLLDRTPGRKDVSIRPRRDPRAAEATEEVPVAPELVDAFCLDDTELTALDHLAGLCDDAYGTTEHDIEFAFHDGQVFLLQRRPITRA